MNEFFQAKGFEALVAKGCEVAVGPKYWVAVFANQADAEDFARYAAGFVKRVITDAKVRTTSVWSDARRGYLAHVGYAVPSGPTEEGAVICIGREVCGIAIKEAKRQVLLPIQPHTMAVVTESGTTYFRMEDGTCFCRSRSDGAQPCARSLWFTASVADSDQALKQGGRVKVQAQPAVGLYPLYVYTPVGTPDAQGYLHLDKASFRFGTRVARVLKQ